MIPKCTYKILSFIPVIDFIKLKKLLSNIKFDRKDV